MLVGLGGIPDGQRYANRTARCTRCRRSSLGSNSPIQPLRMGKLRTQFKGGRTARYGDILAAEGHLLDPLEPEDVVPAWKRWSPILLRPEGLYGTRPVAPPSRSLNAGLF
jgi:hypothetical protein